MRIFKLVRHFAGLQSLIYTLNQAYKELGLLVLMIAVSLLTVRGEDGVPYSAANRLIGEVVQSRRRPLLGPSPG